MTPAPAMPNGAAADPRHLPVMRDEVVAALAPRAGAVYVDGTFGAGGYTRAILDAADCTVVAIDRDPDAIAEGQPLAARYPGRLHLRRGRFGDMDAIVDDAIPSPDGPPAVQGVALDLGVSSMQIDRAERGFSFRGDGPLDMRMERTGQTAADLVANAEESALADMIWRFGDERRSRRIARAIVAARSERRIETTGALAEIVRAAAGRSEDGIDPATRTFQALRIAVNDELGEIDRGLVAAERLLAPGGRLAVVAFHSLEDRPVKDFLRRRAGAAPRGSRHLPDGAPPPPPTFRLTQRRPVTPGAAEIAANPRARSARLRIAERTDAAAWRTPT